MLSHFWCVILYTLRDSHFVLFQASWDASSFWKAQWIKWLEGNDNSDPSTSLMCTWMDILYRTQANEVVRWTSKSVELSMMNVLDSDVGNFWCLLVSATNDQLKVSLHSLVALSARTMLLLLIHTPLFLCVGAARGSGSLSDPSCIYSILYHSIFT